MNYETKRNVVEAILLAKDTDTIWDSSNVRYYLNRYDAALPDDLPMIPKAVGEYIERQKQGSTLRSAIIAATDFNAVDDEDADWIFYHFDTFARAWVLGVWRVEETGEIVKLEAEK
ncbi:hypothetical protein KQ232_01215 [Lacticaseibacillus paracasei]|uniref:hypothetical protein n=1 Tax=Lacticaseibacillus paracasei TaxID=1597 RepID=UPI001C1E6F85|nr:hypothetical protein [Lacticaseibacillus paracasei]MBU6046292.1 hypothetical protein [Lacticaseibacillus paracasei]MCL4971183.1 hypothetical protein [Lacticaseibacillus paracasei]